VAFGEALGDLGRERFGIHAVAFDREEALESLLVLAVALGFIHVLLGLGLGAFTLRRHPREAVARALTAGIVVAGVVALGALTGYLPEIALAPAVGALAVALVALVAVGGVLAIVELLSTFGNILSYARLMAIGTASVMLAVVANDLGRAVNLPVLGVLVAVLFHLINFALGVFSPTIHSLRLHYVEFFGKFYRPGGVPYRPFGHWDPGAERA
jgi:V/A-type H+-transporting ATPase subunit I